MLSEDQRFALDVLADDSVILPKGLVDQENIIFLHRDSWINEIFGQLRSIAKSVHLKDGRKLTTIIIANSEIKGKIATLKILLHELMHKKLAGKILKLRQRLGNRGDLHRYLVEVEVEKLSSRALAGFIDNLPEWNRILENEYGFNKDDVGFEAKVSEIRPCYEDQKELVRAIIRNYGSDAEKGIRNFIYRADDQLIIKVIGPGLWDILVNSFEISRVNDYQLALLGKICLLYAKILDSFEGDDIAEKMSQAFWMFETALSVNKSVFISVSKHKFSLEVFDFFLKAKLSAMDRIFFDWLKGKTDMDDMDFFRYFEQEMLVHQANLSIMDNSAPASKRSPQATESQIQHSI
jgi:hypothetical protein